MTLDLIRLKSNLAELCSAGDNDEFVPSITGSALYNASRGWGVVHRFFYLLCSFSGKTPPVNPLLTKSLRYTASQYELAVKTAGLWLESKKKHEKTTESDLEVVVFLSSFNKTCQNKALLKKLQSLFQNQGLQFDLAKLPGLDFYRRVDTFERITDTSFPFDLIKKALKNPDENLKSAFHEYENKILATLPMLTDLEKENRKGRIVDKLVKIIKDLNQGLKIDFSDAYSIWGRMGCIQLLTILSEKRKKTLDNLDKFRFGNTHYVRDRAVKIDYTRFWTSIPLDGSSKEVIIFHSVLRGAYLVKDREKTEIIPITPAKKYNHEMGLLLKRRQLLSWSEAPLSEYENELIRLIHQLSKMSHLPVDENSQLMELDTYGFDDDDLLTVKLNYTEIPYHIFILHDFLFKACKRNVKDYIRLAGAAKLTQAPMGDQVGPAVLGHFREDMSKIKAAASKTEATEHDFQKYWMDPFQPIAKVNKEKESTILSNYLKTAYGCYPFAGVLEELEKL